MFSKTLLPLLIHLTDAIQAWADLEAWYSVNNGPSIFSLQEQIYALIQGDLTISKYHEKLAQLRGQEKH